MDQSQIAALAQLVANPVDPNQVAPSGQVLADTTYQPAGMPKIVVGQDNKGHYWQAIAPSGAILGGKGGFPTPGHALGDAYSTHRK